MSNENHFKANMQIPRYFPLSYEFSQLNIQNNQFINRSLSPRKNLSVSYEIKEFTETNPLNQNIRADESNEINLNISLGINFNFHPKVITK